MVTVDKKGGAIFEQVSIVHLKTDRRMEDGVVFRQLILEIKHEHHRFHDQKCPGQRLEKIIGKEQGQRLSGLRLHCLLGVEPHNQQKSHVKRHKGFFLVLDHQAAEPLDGNLAHDMIA